MHRTRNSLTTISGGDALFRTVLFSLMILPPPSIASRVVSGAATPLGSKMVAGPSPHPLTATTAAVAMSLGQFSQFENLGSADPSTPAGRRSLHSACASPRRLRVSARCGDCNADPGDRRNAHPGGRRWRPPRQQPEPRGDTRAPHLASRLEGEGGPIRRSRLNAARPVRHPWKVRLRRDGPQSGTVCADPN
jgi:hypothetical protein